MKSVNKTPFQSDSKNISSFTRSELIWEKCPELMSEQKINQEAFKEAEESLRKERIAVVKGYILETLKKLEDRKQQREKLDEEVRILKLDLEDLRNGKFDKIEERIEKSKVARGVSIKFIEPYFNTSHCFNGNTFTTMANNWLSDTAGTYTVGTKTFYF